MKLYIHPQHIEWPEIIRRPSFDIDWLNHKVQNLLDEIRKHGDSSLYKYEEEFDLVKLDHLEVNAAEFAQAERLIDSRLKEAIQRAAENIKCFHSSQKIEEKKVETMPGVVCWQKAVGIDKVGLYIPGGTAPLFSTVLMLAIPAQIAGCENVILCTPPNSQGKIHPAILFAARIAGVHRVFKLGGVQAIGAMAYGTETVPKVFKIFGPGNQFVTTAKQLVSLRDAAIDMPAGPSEVAVIADKFANPSFVASDFLSQAEHGPDSQSVLMTTDVEFAQQVQAEIEKQVAKLPRLEYCMQSLSHSKLIVLKDFDELIELTNMYAPEHLIIQTHNYQHLAERIRNAGSVFLGAYTPESAGDYASGTNHTLPTSGYAKAYSGVNLDSFVKKITFQEISPEGLSVLGPIVEVMASAEHLQAHKNAVTVRLDELKY